MQRGLLRNLTSIIPFMIVLALSLFLLIFVGIGDANRVFPKLHINKITAFGEIVRNSINSFLISGLPLKQFVGFATLARPLLETERAIQRMEVVDNNGNVVFQLMLNEREWEVDQLSFKQGKLDLKGAETEVLENSLFYRISFPLRNKFEKVGSLNLYSPRSIPSDAVGLKFRLIWIVFGALILAFAVLLAFFFRKEGRGVKFGIPLSFIGTFLILAGFIMYTLINLYSVGIQARTQAMAKSLSQRLNTAIDLGLEIPDFTGIDAIFDEYKNINPDISFIALTEKSKIIIHTDKSKIATISVPSEKDFEYQIPLLASLQDSDVAGALKIGVAIPRDIIRSQLIRSGKNFVVLLIASAFLSIIFMNLLKSIRQSREIGESQPEEQSKLKLDLIGPLFFLAVFLEGLFVSFLPQFFQSVATNSNIDPGSASILFTIYFAAFVVSLLPAGRLADRWKVKGLLISGTILFAASYLILAFSSNFYLIILSRVLAGIGQGTFFISVQSYILKTVSKEQKTKGSSLIVFGYNGGMISGTAIGALLVSYLSYGGVFVIAGVAGFFIFLYILLLIPEVKRQPVVEQAQSSQKGGFFKNVGNVIKDFEFVKTILLVGIVTKAILTGVNSFALPLLLSKANYLQEDIGQILIFYSGAVLVSTLYVSSRKDKLGKTGLYLFFGTQLGGLCLYLIGFMNWDLLSSAGIPGLNTMILITGVAVLGFAHGFIHAPIVTHVSESKVTGVIGVASTTSIYRFLERIGHVSGPIIVGQLLIVMAYNSFTISWIGVFAMVSGILFTVLKVKSKDSPAQIPAVGGAS